MSFVLLLLLSITTLVRVETRSTETSIAQLEAKQNAFLALNVAVGELQKSTGPDQRITVRADILDTNPATSVIDGVANPYWLSVYKTTEIGKETQELEALRVWATDRSAAERVDWLVSSRSDLSGVGVNPVTTDVVTLNGGSASNVVTVARYQDDVGTLRDVSVGKVDILGENNTRDGQFAWWVADESAKYRLNTTKDEEVLNSQPFEPRWSIMAPHQSNASILSELSTFDITDSGQQEKLERSFTSEALKIVDSTWQNWLDDNVDDHTLVSYSIPVDVTQGRLKEDLTVYLETNASGLNDSDFIVRGASGDNNYVGRLGSGAFAVDYDQYGLPKFGQLKSWYDTGMAIDGFADGTASAPRVHTQDKHGLNPVILKAAVYFGLSFKIQGTDVYPVFLIYPKFTLWNPHNVPIAPGKYVVQVRARTALNTRFNNTWAARNTSQEFSYKGYNSSGGITAGGNAHFNWANPTNPKGLLFEDDNGNGSNSDSVDNPYLIFVIDNDGFAPGETLLYSANPTDPSDPSRSEYVNNLGIDHLESNHSASDFENHNLLINEDTGEIGFFYIVSNNYMRPDTATYQSSATTGITDPSDELSAEFYVSDTASGVGVFEPSLTTKLYSVSSSGKAQLLEVLDLKGVNDDAGTKLDWDDGQVSGNFSFEELGITMSLSGTPNFEWGYGYYAVPMGNNNGAAKNYQRNFIRLNYLAQRKHFDDTSNNDTVVGRAFAASPSTRVWYDGAYPSAIPGSDYSSGIGFDGYDSVGAYGLLQHNGVVSSHDTVYPLYDYPRSESGLLSLGFLSNVSFAVNAYQASFPFGNSEAHTHITRELAYETRAGFSGTQSYADLSYLINESMWDRFFVSTIPQDPNVPLGLDTVLPNTRHKLVADSNGSFPGNADLRASAKGFEEAAGNLVIEGGFNVNSTSVVAWRLFLSSLLGENAVAANGALTYSNDRVASSKKAYSLLSEVLDAGTGNMKPDFPYVWSSARSLSTSEINALAVEVVAEIKRRGPFLSLADFVNRRLVPDATTRDGDFLGLKGTLQTAIDRISTDPTNPQINKEFYTSGTYSGADFRVDPSTATENLVDAEHERGMPGVEAGSRMFGIPGFLTQADLLSSLAPLLTVRGDTFVIRGYGESISSLSSSALSKAWCEAVVQRVADPVDTLDPGGRVQPIGTFGRQFKIVSVRWLNEDEIL
ncbi:MAG TPA: hypothetical protein DCX06_11005 [Opitutae bacterium]|nr:hypothetical protein [Opitutae bacterium]